MASLKLGSWREAVKSQVTQHKPPSLSQDKPSSVADSALSLTRHVKLTSVAESRQGELCGLVKTSPAPRISRSRSLGAYLGGASLGGAHDGRALQGVQAASRI